MSAVLDALKKVTDGLEFLNETQAPDTETYRHYKALVKEAREQIDIMTAEALWYKEDKEKKDGKS